MDMRDRAPTDCRRPPGRRRPGRRSRGETDMPYPFDRSGTEVGPDGIRRYTGLAQNLPQLLRASVAAAPDAEALVELGGQRVTYQQLWSRAARVAGGLRAAGVQPGDRVANRLAHRNDWGYALWGPLR